MHTIFYLAKQVVVTSSSYTQQHFVTVHNYSLLQEATCIVISLPPKRFECELFDFIEWMRTAVDASLHNSVAQFTSMHHLMVLESADE